MTSRSYTDQTLKKLFALSGNECACPECIEVMVNGETDVFGEICHIRGLESTSKRHDEEWLPQDLNDYKNLIVLCPNHHTKADQNPGTYSIEYLEKMKHDHEIKFETNPFTVNEKTLNALQIHYTQNQSNINESDGVQNNIQSGSIEKLTINNFLDLDKLGQLLFENNYPRILSDVSKIAKESAMKYVQTLVNKANDELTESDIPKLSDPDLQYMFTQSVIATGRDDDPQFSERLASLMIGRIKNSDIKLRKIMYNEAIQTLPKLTEDSLKIITTILLLRNVTFDEKLSTIEKLNETYTLVFNKIMNFSTSQADFHHIVYTGIGSISVGEWNFKRLLKIKYPKLDSEKLLGLEIVNKISEFLKDSDIKNMTLSNIGTILGILYYKEISGIDITMDEYIFKN